MLLRNTDILSFLVQHKNELRRYNIKRIGLFGSYARNNASENSDIDFLVEYQQGKKSLSNFLELIDFLELSFHKDVELVTKESVSKHIFPYIEKEIQYVQIID
jgi:predicted nucleotidyltransferase